jgi:hypothetical protein
MLLPPKHSRHKNFTLYGRSQKQINRKERKSAPPHRKDARASPLFGAPPYRSNSQIDVFLFCRLDNRSSGEVYNVDKSPTPSVMCEGSMDDNTRGVTDPATTDMQSTSNRDEHDKDQPG